MTYLKYSGKIPVKITGIGEIKPGFVVPVPQKQVENLQKDVNWKEVEVKPVSKSKNVSYMLELGTPEKRAKKNKKAMKKKKEVNDE